MPHTNRLAKETSPYLLQHAHNPVDWYPWGEEALERARREDKPILISIGYAACHWCHVMERESFEDGETARLMNEQFVNIKIDREERPDLDHIYMEAVQAIAGSGGWPLNVFLTPAGKPFYGGTYFPPRPVHNRSSWTQVLSALSRAFREKRSEIEEQAEGLTQHITASNTFGLEMPHTDGKRTDGATDVPGDRVAARDALFTPETLDRIAAGLLKTADTRLGGFGHAPKFPQTFTIRWLLHHYHFTHDEAALRQATLSLDKMIQGGIYDQIGGGFARYSTDEFWLVPHFEKMLYDQALLVIVLSEAYQITGAQRYRRTIEQTLDFVRRELTPHTAPGEFPDGNAAPGEFPDEHAGEGTCPVEHAAAYSALDADSEGVEGKFYVWSSEEIARVLGPDAALFCEVYGVSPGGNWEGANILHRPGGEEVWEALTEAQRKSLDEAAKRLLGRRAKRVRPALDDKILLGWNAMLNIALCKAYGALGNEEYRVWAVGNMAFIRRYMRGEGICFYYHGWKAGETKSAGDGGAREIAKAGGGKNPAFLEDYACLISALIHLQEITGDTDYLVHAREVLEFVIEHFDDPGTGMFFFTHRDQDDLVARKLETYDGAVPSGNSVMAVNLAMLGIIFDRPGWRERAQGMARAMQRMVTGYPGSFGNWATLYQALAYLIPEVVITGTTLEDIRKEFLRQMIPYRVFQTATQKNTQFPLLADKPSREIPMIFLCKSYSCQPPVNEVSTLVRHLENVRKNSGKIIQ